MMDINLARAANAYKSNLKMLEGLQPEALGAEATGNKQDSFTEMLGDALRSTVQTGLKAENLQLQAMTGQVELADLVAAIAEAELAVNTVTAIRDRVIGAYQEISRMPL